jgi:hypothetical protein
MQVSSAEVSTSEPGEKKRSAKCWNKMLAQGLCFTCKEQGHLARNCPKTMNVKSNQKGKPPGFGAHGVHLGAVKSVLYNTTEVLDTLPITAMKFGYEPWTYIDVPVSDQIEHAQNTETPTVRFINTDTAPETFEDCL